VIVKRIFEKIERLFRKYDRVVSVLVLFLLLGTYLSKEAFRDAFRDRASAIESAEPLYLAREEMAELRGYRGFSSNSD
jgi:hypothetical protein